VRQRERIKYIVTDIGSKRYAKKVKAWGLAKDDELYDKKEYMWYLLHAGESIFSTFGYIEHKLAAIL